MPIVAANIPYARKYYDRMASDVLSPSSLSIFGRAMVGSDKVVRSDVLGRGFLLASGRWFLLYLGHDILSCALLSLVSCKYILVVW